MNNTVIEVLDEKHGKKVIRYWKSKGADTSDYGGVMTKENGASYRFYGMIDQVFSNYSESQVIRAGAEIITLPEDPEYPKVMEVSIYKDFRDPLRRVVFMKKNGMYLAWAGAATLEEADSEVEVTPWPYARDIEPEPDTCVQVESEPAVQNKPRISNNKDSMKRGKSQLLSKAFIIGAREIVRLTQEDLDELYTERDNISSRISEKERDLEFYNKKIKEFSGD